MHNPDECHQIDNIMATWQFGDEWECTFSVLDLNPISYCVFFLSSIDFQIFYYSMLNFLFRLALSLAYVCFHTRVFVCEVGLLLIMKNIHFSNINNRSHRLRGRRRHFGLLCVSVKIFVFNSLSTTLIVSFCLCFLSFLKLFYLLSVIHVKTSSTYRLFTLLALNLWIGCSFLFHLGALYVCVRLYVCVFVPLIAWFVCISCVCVSVLFVWLRIVFVTPLGCAENSSPSRRKDGYRMSLKPCQKTITKLQMLWNSTGEVWIPAFSSLLSVTGNPDLYSLVRFRRIIKSRSVCFS